MTEDEKWALTEAAKPSGFTPNSESVANFLGILASRGWLHRSDHHPYWVITDAGRAALAAQNAS